MFPATPRFAAFICVAVEYRRMNAWWRVGRKIFVSYRRSDTQAIADQLYERLARHFGAANVFMDRADIEYGQRWRDEVIRQIAAADMFVVLIGPAWLKTLQARARILVRDADDQRNAQTTSRTLPRPMRRRARNARRSHR